MPSTHAWQSSRARFVPGSHRWRLHLESPSRLSCCRVSSTPPRRDASFAKALAANLQRTRGSAQGAPKELQDLAYGDGHGDWGVGHHRGRHQHQPQQHHGQPPPPPPGYGDSDSYGNGGQHNGQYGGQHEAAADGWDGTAGSGGGGGAGGGVGGRAGAASDGGYGERQPKKLRWGP